MARVTLRGAPLVIKKRKTIKVRMGGEFSGDLDERLVGSKDSIILDMQGQGLSDIQYLLKEITFQEAKVQIKNDNPPSRPIVVDNREGKPLHQAERKTETTFGNVLEQAMIKFVERSLMNSIKSLATTPEFKALGTMNSWEWWYVEEPRKSKQGVPLRDTKKLKAMRVGGYLILRPRSNMVGVANMLAARKDAGWPEGSWYNAGRSGGQGFMSKSVDKMKRGNLLKNYTIRTIFTRRFKTPGEIYRQNTTGGAMTPVMIITAKRNRRYARIKR